MKKLIFIFCFSFLFSNAQEKINTVNYKALAAEKFSEGENANKDLGFIDDMLKDSEINFELVFDKNQAVYMAIDRLDINESKANMAQIIFGAKNIYYLNSKSREFIIQMEAYGETFLIPINSWEWYVTNESKKIGKYTCYKATTTMTVENSKGIFKHPVTAWFTNEIPVSFGPKGYYGLPGLILELHEGKQIHVAQNVKLSQDSDVTIAKPIKGLKMTQKEFDNIGKEMDENNQKRN
jgi:GLPGLI family protein